MKNVILSLLFMLPLVVMAQYPQNPVKQRLGYQTSALGITYYSDTIPLHTPSNFLHDAEIVIDTISDVRWMWTGYSWRLNSTIRRVTPPVSTEIKGGNTLDYRYADWWRSTDSVSFIYNWNSTCWQPLYVYESDTAPVDEGAGLSSAAVCYTKQLWLDTSIDSIKIYTGSGWQVVGSGGTGAGLTQDLTQNETVDLNEFQLTFDFRDSEADEIALPFLFPDGTTGGLYFSDGTKPAIWLFDNYISTTYEPMMDHNLEDLLVVGGYEDSTAVRGDKIFLDAQNTTTDNTQTDIATIGPDGELMVREASTLGGVESFIIVDTAYFSGFVDGEPSIVHETSVTNTADDILSAVRVGTDSVIIRSACETCDDSYLVVTATEKMIELASMDNSDTTVFRLTPDSISLHSTNFNIVDTNLISILPSGKLGVVSRASENLVDTLYIESENSASLAPSVADVTIAATTNIDLDSLDRGVFSLDFSSSSQQSNLNILNPHNGGEYVFWIQGCDSDTIAFPNNFITAYGDSLKTRLCTSNAYFDFFYNGDAYVTRDTIWTEVVLPEPVELTGFVLDDYPGADAAYSLRYLNAADSIAGNPVVRLIRKTSLDERDFTPDELVDSLASFANGENVGVQIWYDQAGSKDLTAGANSPTVYVSGVTQTSNGLIAIKGNGLDNSLSNSGNWSYTNGHSIYSVIQLSNTVGTIFGDDRVGNQGNTKLDANATYFVNDNNTGYETVSLAGITTSVQQLISYNIDAASGVYSYQVNGTGVSSSFAGWTGPISGDVSASIGVLAAGGSANFASGFIQELIVYPDDQSSNQTSMSNNINAYYSTY